jgi:hypothetical protein
MIAVFPRPALSREEPPLIVVAFLFPLALYCLILGLVNRRPRPLMVSAAWDFAGILFAASGFLAFGLPGILNGFTESGRSASLVGRPAYDAGARAWFADLFAGLASTLFDAGNGSILIAYFLLVVFGSAYVLWRRRSQTAVYNVHPEVLDEVLAGVLDAAGLSWSRAGNRYFIARAGKTRSPAKQTQAAEAAPPSPITEREPLPPAERRGTYPTSAEDVERSAYLEVEPAPVLCHATLRWETEDADLRKQVEAELGSALNEVRTADNPTASWLLTAGTVLMLASAMIFVFLVVYRILGR